MGEDTLLTVVQRESAAGKDEGLLRFFERGRALWRTRIDGSLERFAVAPRRPLVAVLDGARLVVIDPRGRRRVLRRGISDFIPDGDGLAIVTEKGELERVPFPGS